MNPMMPSRRQFITRVSSGVLAASLWPGRAFAEDAVGENGDFDFIAVNDVHFTDPKRCPPWFEKVFAAMRASAPKAEFVILSGDLTSECTPAEFGGIRDSLKSLQMPVHLTLGNHDVTKTGDRALFSQFFPDKRNYLLDHRGWQIVSLDTVENRAAEKTTIPNDTLKWLDENLPKIDRRKPMIVSTHFPLGVGMIRRPKNANALLSRLANYNVQAVFNGHWHGFSNMMFQDAIISTDRCCSRHRGNHDGSKTKGWFVCEARQGHITRRFVAAPEELIKASSWH